MTSGARALLQYCDVGVTASWENAPPGSAGVPPATLFVQTACDAGPLPRTVHQTGHCGDRYNGAKSCAGGTPALPGGPLSSRLPFTGESAQTNGLDGRLKSQFDNPLVSLRRPSGITLFYFVSGEPVSGASRFRPSAVAAFAARRGATPVPWAYAHGYLLPPLRGSMGRPGVRPGIIKY